MIKIFPLNYKFFIAILLLVFCGNVTIINGSYFYDRLNFLGNFSPFVDMRIVGNYKVFFINNLVIVLISIWFVFSVIKDLNIIKLKKKEYFLLALLLYLPFNYLIINFENVLRGEIGTILKYISYIFFYLVIIKLFKKDPNENENLFKVISETFIVSGVFSALLILFQFYSEFKLHYSALSMIESFRYIRPLSFMGVVTVNSMFMGISFLLLFDRYKSSAKLKSKILILLAMCIIFLGEILSGSRGGIFLIIVVLLHYYALNIKRIRISKNRIMLFIVLLIICLILFIYLYEVIFAYLQSVFLSNSAGSSNESRLTKWKLAFDFFMKNPFFGIGTEQFGEQQYIITGGWSASNPHNLILQMLSENGLFFTLYFLITIVSLLYSYYYDLKNTKYSIIFYCLLYWSYSSLYMGVLNNFIMGITFVVLIASASGLRSSKYCNKEGRPNGHTSISLS